MAAAWVEGGCGASKLPATTHHCCWRAAQAHHLITAALPDQRACKAASAVLPATPTPLCAGRLSSLLAASPPDHTPNHMLTPVTRVTRVILVRQVVRT